MKPLLLFSIAILCAALTVTANAEWIYQTSGTTNHLNGVFFTDTNNGTAVGDGGTILRTTNGGTTWTSQVSGTTAVLNSVVFDDTKGWVVGRGGLILHTTDGGGHWSQQASGTTLELRSVCFRDTANGWAVGGGNWQFPSFIILHTTNGGMLWTTQRNGTTTWLSSVFFGDTNVGWAVGGRGFHTTDGGAQWSEQVGGGGKSVFFIDASTGWIAGGGGIRCTTNGGTTWAAQWWIDAGEVNSIFFDDASNGWAVGNVDGPPYILHTTDGGGHWRFEECPANEIYLMSVHFSDAQNGWIVGGNGTILHTTNGGTTFVEQPRNVELPSQYFLDQNYPNPFNPSTNIGFRISHFGFVSLGVYDVLGREVSTLVNEVRQPGTYSVQWDASGVASGVYFYRLKAGGFVDVKKFVLLK